MQLGIVNVFDKRDVPKGAVRLGQFMSPLFEAKDATTAKDYAKHQFPSLLMEEAERALQTSKARDQKRQRLVRELGDRLRFVGSIQEVKSAGAEEWTFVCELYFCDGG
jgi:hypothetical protein